MGTPSQIAIAPVMTKTPYDPVKDLAPISVVATNPYVLVVHPDVPARTLAEFVDYVRKHPDKLAYAAPVFGGLSHLSMVLFLKRAGLEMTPVSYKGGAAPLADVVAGHVPVYFATLSEAVSHAKSGAIRPLAVSSETRRSEEHTSELQSLRHLVCRLLLEKKKKQIVLLARRRGAELEREVAPDHDLVGLIMPYKAMTHHILPEIVRQMVMNCANQSD